MLRLKPKSALEAPVPSDDARKLQAVHRHQPEKRAPSPIKCWVLGSGTPGKSLMFKLKVLGVKEFGACTCLS